MSLSVLTHGVDSLYLSFKGQLDRALLETMERLKLEAQEESRPTPIAFEGGPPMVVLPHGWTFYRYALRSTPFDLFLAAGDHVPPVYVRISSFYLHSVGVEDAATAVEELVRGHVMARCQPARPSRVDIYADFQGWHPDPDDLRRFVTRGVRNHLYYEPTEEAHAGLSLTGFRFGKDQVVGRLYDKTRELQVSGKDWLLDAWGPRRDPELPVWRLEFQFRREALAGFHLQTAAELFASLQDLWRYGLEWLSLREPSFDRQRSHWRLAEEWVDLATIEFRPQLAGVLRRRLRDHQELLVVRALAGCLTSYAALRGVWDLVSAKELAARAVEAHLEQQGRSFDKVVAQKRLQLV